MTARTALILGIDQYPHSPLQACGIDARRMQERLGRNYDGSANYRCAVVTDADQKLGRSTMMELMEKVFLSAADELVLYFAGHGGVDRFGGFILAQDSHDGGTGIRMSEIVTMANRSDASQVVILMDCCSASAMAERDALAEGVSIITAAREEEIAQAAGNGGLFTTTLCEALDGGAADVRGYVTVSSTYAYVDESFGALQQRPELKTHISRLTPLRRCEPAVSDETLRMLPELFPYAAAEYGLEPAHEPKASPKDEAREEIFARLQRCRAAKLVEPVGHAHMYDAAMAKGSCRLTALGRHYRKMAAADRF